LKLLPVLVALLLCGCGTIKNGYVVTVTGTVLGVQLAQNQVSQMYEGKLGYVRSEIALVPTNGPPVLMEMRYSGLFSFGSSGGIYQRLAVGSNAVIQAGAAFMFAKDANGSINPASVNAVNNAVRSMNQSVPK
jgi:hypothetical protein